MALVLRDERTAGDRRSLTVRVTREGLQISGHDLGAGVARVFGEGLTEYEWERTVITAHLPRLIAALGGAPGADILEVIRDTCLAEPSRLERTIAEHAIPSTFWNRIGD